MPASTGARASKNQPAGGADSAMAPARPNVDASVLDALLELRARQGKLEDLRQRAEERREHVDPAVYRRVTADYQSRLAALGTEAAPLERRLKAEYRKLQDVSDGLRQRLEKARLDKEELEFRRDLGELEEADFSARVQAPASVLAECETELSGLEAQGARFLEALGTEALADDGTTNPVPVADGAAEAQDAPAGGADDPALDATMLGVTQYLPAEEADLAAAGQDGDDSGQTLLMPDAVLIIEDGGAPLEYRLAALNYLGRAEGNQVQLTRGGVSRRHALVALAGPGGYSIKDLQSQNGTFVNGQRIEETMLADGDRITVGDAELTFRLHAPR